MASSNSPHSLATSPPSAIFRLRISPWGDGMPVSKHPPDAARDQPHEAATATSASGAAAERPNRYSTTAPSENRQMEMNWEMERLYQASSGTAAASESSWREPSNPWSVPRSASPRNSSTVER